MHNFDQVDRIRSTLIPKLDRLLQPFGLYAANKAYPHQYVATFECDAEEAEKRMDCMGLLRNGMAGYKTLHPYGVEESSSWAWRYDRGDLWTYRWFGDRQIHITLFAHDGETHLFAHDELNPWRHPIAHYREESFRVEWAVQRARHLLVSNGVPYKVYSDLDRAFSAQA